MGIPKKIHYCWFGGAEKSALIKKCIQSWRKYCPEYEIIEWNESNFDINSNTYAKEAYESKKWAFVSDYARLKIVYEQGGIYLDTDVELIKSLDSVLDYDVFFAMQNDGLIATGLGFGAKKRNRVVKAIMESYSNVHFLKDGKEDETTCPVRNSRTIAKEFVAIEPNKYCEKEKMIFLSKDFFCPFDGNTGKMSITDDTIGIHWFSATWRSNYVNTREKVLRPIKRIMGVDRFNRVKRIIGYGKR